MNASDIAHHRLHNQQIAQGKFERPDQVVAWLGAMQAQNYAAVRWAVGLRCGVTETAVNQAITNKTIVRTWLMRGTLQMVTAADVRWLLALLAPRIIAGSARRDRQLELDKATYALSANTLARALQDGQQLTRAELLQALEQAGISTKGQRGYHMLRRAGLEGLICFGPLQGKQETFRLLDDGATPDEDKGREEALAELAGRYFRSHGPAALPDFVWWSGLKVSDARAGLEAAKSQLDEATIDGQTYWRPPNDPIAKDAPPAVYLLPAFDEYYLGYQSREAVLDPQYDKQVVSINGLFRPMIVIDGQVKGIWKSTLKKGSGIIAPDPFDSLAEAENQALLRAANQYGAFLEMPVVLAD